jgi:hypothetical protein
MLTCAPHPSPTPMCGLGQVLLAVMGSSHHTTLRGQNAISELFMVLALRFSRAVFNADGVAVLRDTRLTLMRMVADDATTALHWRCARRLLSSSPPSLISVTESLREPSFRCVSKDETRSGAISEHGIGIPEQLKLEEPRGLQLEAHVHRQPHAR